MSDLPRIWNAASLPRLTLDPVTRAGVGRVLRRDHCHCLAPRTRKGPPGIPRLHVDRQDISVPGWPRTLDLVRRCAAERAEIFEPAASLPWEEWMGVVTLPALIADLTAVRQMRLYGSHLRRLPPEIGRMAALENLDIYTSYSLHWLPYEVLRCRRLDKSRMSTRALYGNRKTRLPFPRLTNAVNVLTPPTCSICDRALGDATPDRLWVTLPVGTDIVPLLVHSCSRSCTQSLPTPPERYFERPHKGGGGVGMPAE